MIKPTARIVAYVKNACYEDLPSAVIHKAKMILLDTIGVGLAGALTDPAMILLDLIKEMKGKPQATLIRDGTRVNCIQAGFYNSYCMDVMDFEETFEGLGHPNGAVIPAGLAIGEWARSSGKELIVAIVVGNEVSIRLGLAMRTEISFPTTMATINALPEDCVHSPIASPVGMTVPLGCPNPSKVSSKSMTSMQ